MCDCKNAYSNIREIPMSEWGTREIRPWVQEIRAPVVPQPCTRVCIATTMTMYVPVLVTFVECS